MSTRRGAAALAAVVMSVCFIALPGAPAAATGTNSVSFTQPGATYTFTVPQGVTSLTMEAVGGAGGQAVGGSVGGLGAHVSGQIEVAPGQQFTVVVGYAGAEGSVAMGRHGGGGGGATTLACECWPFEHGWGVVAAGGGGGGASGPNHSGSHADGGDHDQPGTNGSELESRGTLTGGNGMGSASDGSRDGKGVSSGSGGGDGGGDTPAVQAATGHGGRGGTGPAAGGGGGGGYVGGGGGGGADPDYGIGGGGAGGSSFAGGLDSAVITTASPAENPRLTVSFPDTVVPTVAVVAPADGSSVVAGTHWLQGTVSSGLGDPTEVTVTLAGPGHAGTPQTARVFNGQWGVQAQLQPGSYTLHASAVDGAGNAASASSTFTVTAPPPVDDDPPAIQVTSADGTTGAGGWFTSAVTAIFEVTDASALTGCTSTFTKSSTGEGAAVTIPSGACSDAHGNSNPGVDAGPYAIDLTDPSATVSVSVADGVATIEGTASDQVSGLAALTVNGETVQVDPSGAFSTTVAVGCGASLPVNVVATDNAGRATTLSRTATGEACPISYRAVFARPVDGYALNTSKARRVIPVKVEVLGSDGAEDRTGPLTIAARPTSCIGGAAGDAVEVYSAGQANTGSLFRWSETEDRWLFNLDTGSLPHAAANTCYRMQVLRDGAQVGWFDLQLSK